MNRGDSEMSRYPSYLALPSVVFAIATNPTNASSGSKLISLGPNQMSPSKAGRSKMVTRDPRSVQESTSSEVLETLEELQLSPSNLPTCLLTMRSCSNSSSGKQITGTMKNSDLASTTFKCFPKSSNGMKAFNSAERIQERIRANSGLKKSRISKSGSLMTLPRHSCS